MSSSVRVESLARWTAGYGLGRRREPDVGEMTDSDWRAWVAMCVEQRITGLAIQALRAGQLQVPEQNIERLRQGHEQAMIQCLQVERGLLSLGPALRNAGVEFLVLKGPSVAHTFYDDPSLRSFADLDILVRTDGWAQASKTVENLGYRRRLPEPRPGFDVRFGKAAEYSANGKPEIDLHRTLVLGPFGLWLDLDLLFDSTTTFEIGGTQFNCLDDTLQLFHACMHASLGWRPPRLVPLRDVAQIAARDSVNWPRLQEIAANSRMVGVLGHAFRCVRQTFEILLPDEAEPFTNHTPVRRERKALAAYTTARRDQGGPATGTLAAIAGTRSKFAYIRALLVPDRSFLVSRSGSDRSHSYLTRWRIASKWLRRS